MMKKKNLPTAQEMLHDISWAFLFSFPLLFVPTCHCLLALWILSHCPQFPPCEQWLVAVVLGAALVVVVVVVVVWHCGVIDKTYQ
jgi:hypothetical protein